MDSDVKITGRIVAAGRTLAGIGRGDFANIAGMPVERIAMLEAGGSAWLQSEDEADALMRALEHFGVVVVAEDDNMGAGVRLKFTRRDVAQIVRLEGEGGIVGSDDAP